MSERIPEDWNTKTISEFVSVSRGYAFKSNDYKKNGLPIVRVTNISGGNKLDLSEDVVFLSPDRLDDFREYILSNDDFLLVMVGATVGKFAKVSIGSQTCLLNQNMWRLRVRNEQIDSQYFAIYGLQKVVQEFLKSQQGSARDFLTQKEFGKAFILTPPLPEQQKIASILTSVDEVIERTQSQINKLQDLKQATMNELLTRGIGHTEFKNSPVGRIPESWIVKTIEEIAKVIRGASPRPKGDPRYYGGSVPRLMGSDVTRDGKFVIPQTDFLTEEGAKLSRPVKKGTLTIVCSGVVGVPSILDVPACIHDGFLALVDIKENCISEFLYYYFLPLQTIFDSSATHGGIFTNLTTQILKEFEITIPPLQEQKIIVTILSSIDMQIEKKQKKLNQIQSLKKSLMQDLLTGKVRVTVN